MHKEEKKEQKFRLHARARSRAGSNLRTKIIDQRKNFRGEYVIWNVAEWSLLNYSWAFGFKH